jgi:pilus assembly protein CpaC
MLVRTRCLATMLVILAWCGGMPSARAQQSVPALVGDGLRASAPAVAPLIPAAPARPLLGPGEVGFEVPQPSLPITAFLQAPQRSDAAIEVIVGQGRMLTLKKPMVTGQTSGVLAIGDPTVVDFEILPNPQMLRVIGKRAGVTDMSIVTADGEVLTLEVHVLYDLDLIRAQLLRLYPDALLKVSQLREHLVLEGEARSPAQVAQIEQTLRLLLASLQASRKVQENQGGGVPLPPGGEPWSAAAGAPAPLAQAGGGGELLPPSPPWAVTAGEAGGRPDAEAQAPAAQVINMLRVPGTQQVMLQVRVAELNRTGLREIGSDLLFGSSRGTVIGTNIAGSSVGAGATAGLGGLLGEGSNALGPRGTGFGIFPSADVDIILRALRKNSLLSILAEPNLVALSGHEATFLAGGQFPVPVPQGGLANQVTIQFKDFGVQLRFVPHIIDEETVRLQVAPEVSTIDASLGTTLVSGGIPVPGINTRRVNTTVEMREGETLALAGLLQVTLDAQTSRIPGLGDLPYIGPLFSNTSHQRIEKELLVLVTPHLIAPMPPGHDVPYPGQEIQDPNDLEFFFLNRIEGRTGRPYRSTTTWDNPLGCVQKLRLEQQCIQGPVGFSR